MRLSQYWFRTRTIKNVKLTSFNKIGRKAWFTPCICEKCNKQFNKTFEAEYRGFDKCRSCLLSDVVKSNYNNYAEKHRLACQIRSSSEQYRQKLSISAARGGIHAIKTSCGKQGISLDKFNGFLTGLDVIERERCKTTVAKDCLFKANFKCDICNKNNKLHAHHLNGWHWAINERFNIDNLVALCHGCHSHFHSIYGRKWNTKEQYIEFKLKVNSKV